MDDLPFFFFNPFLTKLCSLEKIIKLSEKITSSKYEFWAVHLSHYWRHKSLRHTEYCLGTGRTGICDNLLLNCFQHQLLTPSPLPFVIKSHAFTDPPSHVCRKKVSFANPLSIHVQNFHFFVCMFLVFILQFFAGLIYVCFIFLLFQGSKECTVISDFI